MRKLFASLLCFMVFFTLLAETTTVSAQASAPNGYSVTSDFLTFASQGKIKGFPVFLGMKRADLIKLWGQPTNETINYTEYDPNPISAPFNKNPTKCVKCQFRTLLFIDYNNVVDSITIPIKPTTKQSLITLLGKPKEIHQTESGTTDYVYQAGNVEAHFSGDEETDYIYDVWLTTTLQSRNAAFPIKVFVDGKQVLFVDHPTTLINGTLYIPVPEIIYQLGGELNYNPQNGDNSIGMTLKNSYAEFISGTNKYVLNNKAGFMKQQTTSVNKRILIPFADFARIFNVKYSWDGNKKILNIFTK
ncbi:hypothetical protein BRE01_62670 [Brevibacillus reuszeri]|uniref:Copper amine oxidase-like N-terminal domain-containing protein n=1 Tax=Brevibacillus reuszeri TaxID=54915 RepID=A0ABQ0TXK9_9BACL|nr:copper amine oxidase N-terminal domain-containing protein [Brevibacillus reuszeri]GED72565.1 hypothetical protein BRE01_62670 [Brevibacillus reuszeri]